MDVFEKSVDCAKQAEDKNRPKMKVIVIGFRFIVMVVYSKIATAKAICQKNNRQF